MMRLFTMQADIGGRVVISIEYDNKGNVVSKIVTEYEDQGSVVYTEDM